MSRVIALTALKSCVIMSSMAINLTDTQIEALKQHYLENPSATLKDISRLSLDICGIEVDIENVKWYARSGRWGTLKSRHQMGKEGLPATVQEEAEDIKTVAYDMMMDPDTKNRSVDEMVKLISIWEKMGGYIPTGRSRKTTMQTVTEAAQMGLRKAKEFDQSRSESDE